MRDIVLAAIILACLPVSFLKPYLGVYIYAWIGLMNPHRLSWGLASAPVGMAVALATIGGMFVTRQAKGIPLKTPTVLILVWFAYTSATTFLAMNDRAWIEWDRFSRIMVMCIVAAVLLQSRKKLEGFLLVCTLSIAFFGVKGGIFSILTGGNYRVWGPQGSFIAGNNELALVELMVLPFMLYFLRQTKRRSLRLGYYAMIFLTIISIIFSYSRGALVGLVGVGILMVLRSRYRLQVFLIGTLFLLLSISFLPRQWTERMMTIETYQQDASAMGRINAWRFATNLAVARVIGGGFRSFTPEMFRRYAPNPLDVHDAHSIYFEVLGEQGFPGLLLFLAMIWNTLTRMERLRKAAHAKESERWASDMAEMIQFSVLAYGIAGAFLGLAYFDLFYEIVIAAMLLDLVYRRDVAAKPEEVSTAAPTGPMPARAIGGAPA